MAKSIYSVFHSPDLSTSVRLVLLQVCSSDSLDKLDDRDTLIVYDWDDTLCPSSWMQTIGVTPHTSAIV